MRLLAFIALRHLLSRKRQSIVSLLGIIIGVAFFLAISSLMQGSQKDFIKRLVDNSPHITISDEYRTAKEQPATEIYKDAAIELRSVKPQTETRGIRGYRQIVEMLRRDYGVRASPVLSGTAIVNFAGRDDNITLSGMIPEDMRDITTIEEHMVEGSVDDLLINRNGIALGQALMKRLSLEMGDNITLTAATGQVRVFKIVAMFNTGRSSYDNRQGFVDIKRVQSMLDRANRANTILIKMDDPGKAQQIAEAIEKRIGYKSESWQEASQDIRSTLLIRNIIMYSVVSAVLIVAAFGIYNIISTVVMEKQRDIAILKSMGFYARDVRRIFLIQGAWLGLAGLMSGLPLGCVLMFGLTQIKFKPPGSTEIINMPIDWSPPQFIIAGVFAFLASVLASYLPARKAAQIMPVDILRGGA